MKVSIKVLKKMTIGQIKDLEKSMNKIGDVIDQKKELLKYINEPEEEFNKLSKSEQEKIIMGQNKFSLNGSI